MTQIESKPASSAVRTTRASVGPMAAAPPGQVNWLTCSPNFIRPIVPRRHYCTEAISPSLHRDRQLVRDDAVSAGALGEIERGVGAAQERLRIATVDRIAERHPARDRERRQVVRRLGRDPHALGDRDGAGQVASGTRSRNSSPP